MAAYPQQFPQVGQESRRKVTWYDTEHSTLGSDPEALMLDTAADKFFIGTLADAQATQAYIAGMGYTLTLPILSNYELEDAGDGSCENSDGNRSQGTLSSHGNHSQGTSRSEGSTGNSQGTLQGAELQEAIYGGKSVETGCCGDHDVKHAAAQGPLVTDGHADDPSAQDLATMDGLATIDGRSRTLPKAKPPLLNSAKTFRTTAVKPQRLRFTAPSNSEPGQKVCISGPHGPLLVALPEDARAGEPCAVQLAPPIPFAFVLTVPKNACQGQKIEVCGPDGAVFRTTVPRDKQPGDSFEVLPPCLMVHVPQGASPQDVLVFDAPDGTQSLSAMVPEAGALVFGEYFPILLQQ